MNTLNLSKREQAMFDVLKQKDVTSVDELLDAVKKFRVRKTRRRKRRTRKKPQPTGTRSMTVSVRYLGFKIAPRGYYIERISDLGRGNKAHYRLHRRSE